MDCRLFISRRGSFALAALLLSIPAGGGGIKAAEAQTLDFRDPAKAPPSWIQFAKLVKYRFEEWGAGDDAIAARFRVYLKAHSGTSDGPPSALTVKAWINPDGTVERVSFPAFADAGATQDLRTVLTRGNVGEAPPPEMLQPLNLRFSLNLKK